MKVRNFPILRYTIVSFTVFWRSIRWLDERLLLISNQTRNPKARSKAMCGLYHGVFNFFYSFYRWSLLGSWLRGKSLSLWLSLFDWPKFDPQLWLLFVIAVCCRYFVFIPNVKWPFFFNQFENIIYFFFLIFPYLF